MNYSPYRNILRMVSELHARGYQKIRIAPSMAPSGLYWRCAITSSSCISSRHGAIIANCYGLIARYSSSSGRKYFDWDDATRYNPSRLAELFIKRFPEIANSGKGSDWAYAGWYLEMLYLTDPDCLPIASADYPLPKNYIRVVGERDDVMIPLPPVGDCREERKEEI
jgi:hypothetical protein